MTDWRGVVEDYEGFIREQREAIAATLLAEVERIADTPGAGLWSPGQVLAELRDRAAAIAQGSQ